VTIDEREALLDAFAATGMGGTAMRLFLIVLDAHPRPAAVDQTALARRLAVSPQAVYEAAGEMARRGVLEKSRRGTNQQYATFRLLLPPYAARKRRFWKRKIETAPAGG
jgi:hypothetical protein